MTSPLLRGLPDPHATLIGEAILLHSGHANGHGTDVELVMVGAAQDLFGPSLDKLSDEGPAALEREVFRLAFKARLRQILQEHVVRSAKPTWTASFALHPPPSFLASRWS